MKEELNNLLTKIESIEKSQIETQQLLIKEIQQREIREKKLLKSITDLEASNQKLRLSLTDNEININKLTKWIYQKMWTILNGQNEIPALLKDTIEDATQKNISSCLDKLGLTSSKINEISRLQAINNLIEAKLRGVMTDKVQKHNAILKSIEQMGKKLEGFTMSTLRSEVGIINDTINAMREETQLMIQIDVEKTRRTNDETIKSQLALINTQIDHIKQSHRHMEAEFISANQSSNKASDFKSIIDEAKSFNCHLHRMDPESTKRMYHHKNVTITEEYSPQGRDKTDNCTKTTLPLGVAAVNNNIDNHPDTPKPTFQLSGSPKFDNFLCDVVSSYRK
jgi:hypothetical protein